MTTWTNITDASLEPGKPLRSIDLLALRDNPIALSEGSPGAPATASASLADYPWGAEDFQTGTDERDWVLGRTSGAAAGAVGTYAFAQADAGTTSVFGDSISGSRLTPSSVEVNSSGSVSGTWRCMGIAYGGTGSGGTTLWLRIS